MAKKIRYFKLPIGSALFLALSTLTVPALALDELFETYTATQALAMGNALTADATGVNALFHNPAGLAKILAKDWSLMPVAIDLNFSGGFAGATGSTRSFGINRHFNYLQANPGAYTYFKTSGVPAFVRRNMGIAFIGGYEAAAKSDGTNVDVRSAEQMGIVIGGSTNLAANMLKVGVAVKTIVRNELNGVFAHTQLATDDAIAALKQEGIGFGADLGMMITLPVSYLPTLGFTWKDVGNTFFRPFTLLNGLATGGSPQEIEQSFNVAFSAHPALGRGIRALFSAEFRHIERTDLPLRKRLHFGFQFITRKGLYIWAGMNQLFPTFGVGLRVRGGHLEVGSYAQDIGVGQASADDRRFFLRYTIGY